MSTSDGAVLGATKIVDNGPANLRFNLLILSEGYRSSEMAQFAADAQQFANTLFATPPGAMEIALHEMGHTAFGFADEYEYYAGCVIDVGHDHHPGTEPVQPNVTVNPNRGTIKWRSLILPATPVPTTNNADCSQCDPQPSPVSAGTVGAFEGADYYHCGCYRPEFNCRMRALGNAFCAVCQKVIVDHLTPFLP